MPVAFRKAGSPDRECDRAEAGSRNFLKKNICDRVPVAFRKGVHS